VEVKVGFEPTILRICNPLPWATRPLHRIVKTTVACLSVNRLSRVPAWQLTPLIIAVRSCQHTMSTFGSGLNNRVVTPPTVGVAYSFAQGLNNNAILKHTGVSECICRAVRPDLSTSTPHWVLIWTQLNVFQYGAVTGAYSTGIVNEL
jgi:hypothetical protein